jgi:hypothetical protein
MTKTLLLHHTTIVYETTMELTKIKCALANITWGFYEVGRWVFLEALRSVMFPTLFELANNVKTWFRLMYSENYFYF